LLPPEVSGEIREEEEMFSRIRFRGRQIDETVLPEETSQERAAPEDVTDSEGTGAAECPPTADDGGGEDRAAGASCAGDDSTDAGVHERCSDLSCRGAARDAAAPEDGEDAPARDRSAADGIVSVDSDGGVEQDIPVADDAAEAVPNVSARVDDPIREGSPEADMESVQFARSKWETSQGENLRNLGRRRRPRALSKPEPAAARKSLSGQQRLLLLDTWRRSGLPAGDFAPLVGVSATTLYKWRRRDVRST
jgi:hypothetical protein